jgi:hypothetical protein
MARKKEPPKPLAGLRFDFVESLENVCQQSLMLLQVVDTILKHQDEGVPLKPGVLAIMQQRADALREALIGRDD